TSLLLLATIVAAVGLAASWTRRRLRGRRHLRAPLLELLGTFQVCACTNELALLAEPRAALTLTYGLAVLHGWTLAGCSCNPCGSLQLLRARPAAAAAAVAAQFAAAALARAAMSLVWSLGMAEPHLAALARGCGNPMQTTEAQAFCIELLFSVVFQLTILRVESLNPKYKVHLIALLITVLVYAGGNLTGAVFNPALALSLHPNCFYDKFWSYSLVYWVAPSLGKSFTLHQV
ncbi:AQP11 protein, partial [Centropus unirufus]|nr:AQP11 protein [Centropus unirufus]